VLYDQCGTPAYIAPEIIAEEGYDRGTIDMWSAGVVLYAMLYGNVPFKGADMKDLHKQIIEANYELKDEISAGKWPCNSQLLNNDLKAIICTLTVQKYQIVKSLIIYL
jgi:5'-AMP-activated protein kinase catalytic alpha subunit